MGRARDISKVFSTGTALATDTEVSTTYQTKATAGLTLLTPTSIVATGGSGSISTNGAVSFTSASAISLNDVFSATYNNYRIIVNANNSSASADSLRLRLRVSGVDNTSSNYRWSGIYVFDATASPTVSGQGSNGLTTSFLLGSTSSTVGFTGGISLDLYNPFATKNTGYVIHYDSYDQFAPRSIMGILGGVASVTTSYTGFTLIVDTGTITGTVSVYGYNK